MKKSLGLAVSSIFAVSALTGCSSESSRESISTVDSIATVPNGIRLSSTYEVLCDPSDIGNSKIISSLEDGHGPDLGEVEGDATRLELAQIACQTFGIEYVGYKEPTHILASFTCKFSGTDPCAFGSANAIGVVPLTPTV